jgi:hypothetical protein
MAATIPTRPLILVKAIQHRKDILSVEIENAHSHHLELIDGEREFTDWEALNSEVAAFLRVQS